MTSLSSRVGLKCLFCDCGILKSIKAYIFLAGFAVTGVEMAASRFLAPYFGTSSVVWANVIGVILLALALGYTAGGRLADRFPNRQLFFSLGGVGAMILALLPFAGSLVLKGLSAGLLQTSGGLIVATFLASLLLFGFPVFFFACLSPFAVRLLSQEVSVVGARSGALSFWSTLGSILGIYVTSLYLVPVVGVRESIWIFSALLFFPSVAFLPKKIPVLTAFVLVFTTSFILVPPAKSYAAGQILHEQESTYQFLRVVENAEGTRLLTFNEGQGVQSMYNPRRVWTGAYYDYAAPLPLLKRFSGKKELSILVLGYAGGTLGKILRASAPKDMQITIDAVEIDPVVTELSKQYFGVRDDERTMYTMDGRSFLQQSKKQYDLIFIDAYSQEIYIPPHMLSTEFFSEVAAHLTPEGLAAFNINVVSNEGKLFQSAIATVRSAGLSVYDMAVPGSYNHWILASKQDFVAEFAPVTEDPLRNLVEYFSTNLHEVFAPSFVAPLTDNRSPVELFIHEEILRGMWGK